MSTPTVVAQAGVECGVFDVGCQAGQAIGSAFEGIVAQVAQGAAELVVSASAWWVETDSVNPLDPAVDAAQDATRGLVLVILVGSVLTQSIRMIISRKGEPLVMVALGLLRYAIVSALGLAALSLALRAGDALAVDLLDGAASNFAVLMRDLLTSGEGNAVFLILLVSLIAAVLSLVQWVLMAMRQAGLLVLAAMLPLAASGSLTRSTRGWLDKLLVWLIAMVVYKPAAAFIYYIGFSYLSSPAASSQGTVGVLLTGIMVLLLAVLALPVLLKFFAWSGTQIGGANGGGGSGMLGAIGAVAMSQSHGRGAVDRASAMEANGPGSFATFGTYPPPAGAAPPAGGPPTPSSATSAAATGSGAAGSGAAAGLGAAGVVATAGVEAVRRTGQAMTGGTDGDPQ